ncbi:polyamine ABC transporter substrate-binding protein [Arthrobacter sp. JZ12]|uniref:polyamine ABC transporter substrate-binding protein n=1 Tax=Arthrobacter sp. JZ12 TaxID=2654190 RepID=UPI002B49D9D4|nr:polyamine ABC transporter substrate-binding protein [Arthrobacter sp. JZ12]
MNIKPLIAGVAAVAAVTTMSGCAVGVSAAGEGEGELTFVSAGGAFQDAQIKVWQEPYTAETGTGFVNDSPIDDAKMKLMVDSGNVIWDTLSVTTGTSFQYCDEYLEKLDFSVIDKDAYPEGLVSDCGVPVFGNSQYMLYNTDAFGGNPPTTAADFFDLEKFPGKRLLLPEITVGLIEFALIADGVPRDDLYPLDVERALAKLDTIKSELVFTETYAQVQQALESSQVEMALSLNARAALAMRNGAPFAPVWDTVIMTTDSLVIPKGAPNKEEAMKFIASVQDKEKQADIAELLTVNPIDEDVKPELDEVQQSIYPFDHEEALVYSDPAWWGENQEKAIELYNAWKSK